MLMAYEGVESKKMLLQEASLKQGKLLIANPQQNTDNRYLNGKLQFCLLETYNTKPPFLTHCTDRESRNRDEYGPLD